MHAAGADTFWRGEAAGKDVPFGEQHRLVLSWNRVLFASVLTVLTHAGLHPE